MAEETLYDEQVVTDDQGDPKDPLGLRKKLSATKTKEDPLGLRAKLKPVQAAPVSHEQALALPKIDYSKPVFQENVSESTSVPQVNNQALLATPPRETVAEKFENKVKQSRDKVLTELTTNDKAIENLIRKQKFEDAGRNVELPNSDMPVNGALANDVARMVKPETRAQDMPVTPEEMQQKKALVANDDSQARRLLEEVVRVNPEKKNEVQKSIYDLDIANAIQNDPNGQARVRKVLDNSKKLESGELVYDWRQGRLFKPENIAQSFITGWKAKTQALDDYYKFRKIENNDAIAMELDARMASQDPDAPTPIPEGKLAQGAEMLGGTPAKAYAAGAAGSLLGPQAGMVAGAAVGAREMAKLEWNNTFQRTYAELRQKGTDGFHAVSEARKLADEAAEMGAVTGLVTGLVGGRIGMKALPKVALNEGFRKAAVNGLKGLGSTLSPAVKEGLLAGGVAAGGEIYKNALAKEAGLNRNIDDNVAEQIESNLLFTVGMAAAIKGSKLLSPKAYKTLLSGLSRADEGYIDKTLSEAVDNGQATEADVTKLKDDLSAFKKEDSTIPENISPEARLQISEQIKKRNALEAKMEATDKAFHPAIKEQIKGIEENINALSEDKVKAPDEHKELNKVIDSAIEDGLLTGIYKDIAQKDPEGFFRELADQIHGKNTDGSTSLRPDAEIEVRTQFGDDIVDKAIEMFPAKPIQDEITPIYKVIEKFSPEDRMEFAKAILSENHEKAKELLRKFDSDYSIASLANEIVTKSKEKYTRATDAQIDEIKNSKTPKDVLNTIIDTTSDPSLKEVAKVFHDNIDKAPFLEFFVDIPKDRNGMPVVDAWGSYAGGKAHVRERAFWERKNNYFNKGLDTGYATILHEFTHAFTIDAYRKPKSPVEREFKQYIDKTYKELKNNAELKDQYGFTSPEEFIAEVLVNPEFRLSAPIYKSGVLDKIVDFLSKIFTNLKKVDKNIASDQRYEKMKEAFDYILKSVPDIRAGKGKDIFYSKGDKFSEFIAGVKDKTELLKKLGFTDEELAALSSTEPKKSGISVIRPEERTQPTETVTIKPKEAEIAQESNVIVPEQGAESIQPKMYDLPFTPEEGDVTRLAHQDTEQIYKELGLGDRVPRTHKTDEVLELQADELIKNGYDFEGKANRVIEGDEKSFTDAEQVAFAKMVGALKVKANKLDVNSPEFDAIQSKIEKLSRASDIAGSEEGAAFRARRLFVLNDQTLSDFMMKAKRANRDAPLTETQKAEVKESFEKVTKAKKKYEEAVEKQTESDVEKKAEEEVKKTKSTAKKDVKRDYVAERKQIFSDIKEKLKKSRGETSISIVPGANYIKDLFVVAPDVAKLVKSLVEEGIDKLPDIVRHIHGQLKEIIPDIKEKDVHDLIAGEYNEKKKPKSAIQEQVYDLQLQAKYINKLEALENGIKPKNENQLRKRSREVEELRKKIKGLQKELGTNKNALQAIKTRTKNKIAELQEKIKNKDYEPDAKPEPITLDKEAQDLQDQYIAEKKKWDLGVAQQDYKNRPLKEKAWDIGTGILDLRRAIGTALDFSVPFRQALPVTINPLKIKTTGEAFSKMFSHFASENNLDRWWFDLESSPDYKAMLEDGLPVKSPNELRLSKREEEFRTNLAQELPLGAGKAIKASNRAASGYLNTMRVDLYRKGTEMLKEQGMTRKNSPEAYKKLASGIGDLTGAGKVIGPLQGKPEQLLGNIFFGPKLMAAKFNLLNPYRYATMPKRIRIRALRDLAVRVGMYTTIGALAKAAGWTISLDPNDADFLKLKHGQTTYDITGGEAIYVRTALRILAAAYKRVTTPNATETDTKAAINKASYSTTSFFRNKLAPLPAYAMDAFMGKKSYGADFDPYDIVRLYPMWIDDMIDDWKVEGPNSILAAALPSIFGIGVQTKTDEKTAAPAKSSGKKSHSNKKTNKRVTHKKS